ncbi:amino acid transporter [Paenibacillus sp. PK3_47]|uniref:LysE family transporter n=1 Tax=Paenibacillus sp. PK3_47 TaxID=2072642 RepID=UPI00201D8228|nr:LysE family transporter [Paenibacillus sp. PK3_47]UQZ36789.1 amino acid transporter [Paenibacillus sp. PK3_47]
MSIQLLLSYIFLGLTLAAPMGPVNSARLDKGIKNGFWNAWSVGAGSMIADGIFMLLIYMGMVRFLNMPEIQIFLWIFGSLILVYSGIESILTAEKVDIHATMRNKESLLRSFMTGFMVSITSPLSILFWLGIYGSILAKTANSYGTSHLLIYSSMIFLGLALWDLCVASLTTGLRRFLNESMLKWISIISGASLVGFGVYFGIQGIKALWG